MNMSIIFCWSTTMFLMRSICASIEVGAADFSAFSCFNRSSTEAEAEAETEEVVEEEVCFTDTAVALEAALEPWGL